MENGQPMKTGSESEFPEDTLGDLTKSSSLETMPLGASGSTPEPTNAITRRDSKKTLKNAELSELRSKIGLVAGALADFQEAGGMILTSEVEYKTPSGSTYKAVKLLLFVAGVNVVAEKTADGLDFNLAAE